MSGDELSTRVAVRKATVLEVLKADPRFECLGRGRGSRWRPAGNRNDPVWEPIGTDPGAGEGETLACQVDDLERRVVDLERMLAELRA